MRDRPISPSHARSYLLGTMAGGAADCQYWETYLGIQARLHELREKERISVAAASKYLSNLVYSYKGMGLSMGTMICGWDKTGPALFYVDSEGARFKGDVFSVGSGSTFAYGVLDQGYHWDLEDEEALELGRRSIYAAGHRDAFSGNTLNLYHVQKEGWKFIENVDLKARRSKADPLTRTGPPVRPRLRARCDPRRGPSCISVDANDIVLQPPTAKIKAQLRRAHAISLTFDPSLAPLCFAMSQRSQKMKDQSYRGISITKPLDVLASYFRLPLREKNGREDQGLD